MGGTCRGIDVSSYQNTQDWGARKDEGIVFAFAKASEGQHTRDDHFATHIKGIKAAGLVPGAYHFGWPTQDSALEAANYIAAVKPYAGPGFVHWLDLERRSDGANYAGRTAAQVKAWAIRWLALVNEAFPGQRVGVYTSGDDLSKGHVPAGAIVWYPAYTWGSTAVPYSKAEAAPRPHPSGWDPLFWQFTSTPLDRSICYLTESGLRHWAAGTTEGDDMPTANEIADAVLHRDTIAAPKDSPDIATNPTWQLQSYIKDTNERTREVQKSLAGSQPVSLTDAQIAAIAGSPELAENIAELVAVKLAARLAS